MRPILAAALALPILLAACEVTPRQQCEAPYRAELRTVRAEIDATEDNIRRGYRLVPARFDFGVRYCLDPFGDPELCTADEGRAMYDKQPINRAAERAKLATLYSERDRLGRALAQCAVQFPE